jgi:hypothetical protein
VITLASSFLAGSILSLVMLTLIFIGLVIWYVKFVRTVPDTAEGSEARNAMQAVGPVEGAPADAASPGEH